MNKKQTLLESFFEKGERPNDEIAEDSKAEDSRLPTKRKLHLKENARSPT